MPHFAATRAFASLVAPRLAVARPLPRPGPLAALLHARALAFEIVKYLGVAYLLYMAWSIWRNGGALDVTEQKTALPARRIVVVNALDALRQIFIETPKVYEPKSPQMRQALTPLLGDGLFVSDGEVWRRRRAWVAPALESAQLPHYAPLMAQCAEETAARWATTAPGQTIDVLGEMAVLAARILGRTVFGDGISASAAARAVRGVSA